MTEVDVAINGIILFCDESIAGIQLGNNYSISKRYVSDLPFKNMIMDGSNKLNIHYRDSILSDHVGEYFMCLHKDDKYEISLPQHGTITFSNNNKIGFDKTVEYQNKENAYIDRMLSLLHLYKIGNIGYKELFYVHKFFYTGKITYTQTINNVSSNIFDNRIFTLASSNDVIECNNFLRCFGADKYDIFKPCIDKFIWGLEQVNDATAFEQYTTALEMLLLSKNQKNKKQVLSKRIAVLLEATPDAINNLYQKVLNFYRFRSESLHEGKNDNISTVELHELEDIVRKVLIKLLYNYKQEASIMSWDAFKSNIISNLANHVQNQINMNILPQ